MDSIRGSGKVRVRRVPVVPIVLVFVAVALAASRWFGASTVEGEDPAPRVVEAPEPPEPPEEDRRPTSATSSFGDAVPSLTTWRLPVEGPEVRLEYRWDGRRSVSEKVTWSQYAACVRRRACRPHWTYPYSSSASHYHGALGGLYQNALDFCSFWGGHPRPASNYAGAHRDDYPDMISWAGFICLRSERGQPRDPLAQTTFVSELVLDPDSERPFLRRGPGSVPFPCQKEAGADCGDRTVRLKLSEFWINSSPTRRFSYERCVRARACPEASSEFSPSTSGRVVEVPWSSAQSYCQWAGGDLPTEGQWILAKSQAERRGTVDPQAIPLWYSDEAEWVRDRFSAAGFVEDAVEPVGPRRGTERTLRGLRRSASWRSGASPEESHSFRCVRGLLEIPQSEPRENSR